MTFQMAPEMSRQYDEYLISYQEDMNRIIGKHRRPNHLLTHDELISEANMALVKYKGSILEKLQDDFNETSFKKMAYSFVSNQISWSHSRQSNHKYVKRRVDMVHETEDGPKTTFEASIATRGEEDEGYTSFDRNEKCAYLLNMVKKYSDILTDGEVKVLSMLEKGDKHEEISEKLGITRQAVSICAIHISEKIRAHLKADDIKDNNSKNITKGREAINSFFTPESGNTRICENHKEALRGILLDNIKVYTPEDISEKFFKGIYTYQQIISFATKNGIGFCLVKKECKSYKFTKEEEKLILELWETHRSSKKISEITGIPQRSLTSKIQHLTNPRKKGKWKAPEGTWDTPPIL
jgi:RNA polymerase sigma factor (sigma-70 family)